MSSQTSTTTSAPKQTVRTGRLESVRFHDGMIVTADDLDAAMQYPASMLRVVLRSFFGCGIVCGLEVQRLGADPTFVVCVTAGVAFDCNGYPIELCDGVRLDLSPDPCACEEPPGKLFIAVRRATTDELPRDPCAVDTGDTHLQCTRQREHVIVRAFTEAELRALGDDLCAKPEATVERHGDARAELAECLTTCPSCRCTEASWILLAQVNLTPDGIAKDTTDTLGIDPTRRKHVRVVQCLLDQPPPPDYGNRVTTLESDLEASRRDIDRLTNQLQALEQRLS